MKLELTGLPEGCQAAVIENSETVTTNPPVMRVIGKAVCGSRYVQATSEYLVPASAFTLGPNVREEARIEVNADLTAMLGAMCADCPRRQETEAQKALRKRFSS